MTLPALDLLGSVVTAFLSAHARGLDRLAIHYGRAGLEVPIEPHPHPLVVRRTLDRRQAKTHRRLPRRLHEDLHRKPQGGEAQDHLPRRIRRHGLSHLSGRRGPCGRLAVRGCPGGPRRKCLKEGQRLRGVENRPPFGRYIFVDRNPAHTESLGALRQEFPELADRIYVRAADANEFLQEWCRDTDWDKNRAVVFL